MKRIAIVATGMLMMLAAGIGLGFSIATQSYIGDLDKARAGMSKLTDADARLKEADRNLKVQVDDASAAMRENHVAGERLLAADRQLRAACGL